jgi:hypothetical protein
LIEYGIGVFFLNLKKMGIVEDLLLWYKDYLSNRKQRVIINGKESSWKTVNAGVRQRSILGPLLFPIFINDIVDEVNCPIKLYADDISIYAIVDKPLITSLSHISGSLCICIDGSRYYLQMLITFISSMQDSM